MPNAFLNWSIVYECLHHMGALLSRKLKMKTQPWDSRFSLVVVVHSTTSTCSNLSTSERNRHTPSRIGLFMWPLTPASSSDAFVMQYQRGANAPSPLPPSTKPSNRAAAWTPVDTLRVLPAYTHTHRHSREHSKSYIHTPRSHIYSASSCVMCAHIWMYGHIRSGSAQSLTTRSR